MDLLSVVAVQRPRHLADASSNGSKERVTRRGGFIASESADGRTLLYISKSVDSPLMAQPVAGGAPRQVIDCVAGTAFSVTRLGIYYLPCSGSSAAIRIRQCT